MSTKTHYIVEYVRHLNQGSTTTSKVSVVAENEAEAKKVALSKIPAPHGSRIEILSIDER